MAEIGLRRSRVTAWRVRGGPPVLRAEKRSNFVNRSSLDCCSFSNGMFVCWFVCLIVCCGRLLVVVVCWLCLYETQENLYEKTVRRLLLGNRETLHTGMPTLLGGYYVLSNTRPEVI